MAFSDVVTLLLGEEKLCLGEVLVHRGKMSKKLIEFLVHYSDCSYNVIDCFYAEICTIYQISILKKLLAEMKISARIRSENSSMAR